MLRYRSHMSRWFRVVSLLVFAVGLPISFLLWFGLALYFCQKVLVMIGKSGTTSAIEMGVALSAGFVGLFVWIFTFQALKRRWLNRKHKLRRRRLEAILGDGRAADRLPHRVLEYALRFKGERHLEWFLFNLPPNRLILRTEGYVEPWCRPAVTDISFEPIDVLRDVVDLNEIAQLNALSKLGATEYERQSVEHEARGTSLRDVARRVWPWLGYLWLPYIAYSIITGASVFKWIFGGILILMALFDLLFGVGLDLRWWVVPGGFIRRRTSVWSRRTEGMIVTADQSSVCIDANEHKIWIVIDGMVESFPCAQWHAWPIAAAWLSEGRTPSLDEVQAFLGPDVRMKT